MRRLLAWLIAIAIAALAAGCGDEGPTRAANATSTTEAVEVASSDLEAVEVAGDPGAPPTLEFPKPLGLKETASRLVDEGEGEAIVPGAVVTFDFLIVNARDGKELQSSFEGDPAELVFEESLMPGIFQGLDGVAAGSRVLVGVAPGDGLGPDPSQGVRETDTLLFFAEILEVRIPLQRATGEAIPPVAGLPTVELADDGAPTITVPDATPPADLVVQPLIDGAGTVVESGQTITVHYTGVLWDEGTAFDSSWERGAPATFEIGTGSVIPGWDEGLIGREVGSQILLVIPPDKGYGDTGSGEDIPPGATLVFVVDILDAA